MPPRKPRPTASGASGNDQVKKQRAVDCVKMLDIAKESADWFPPLKAALGGVNALISHFEQPKDVKGRSRGDQPARGIGQSIETDRGRIKEPVDKERRRGQGGGLQSSGRSHRATSSGHSLLSNVSTAINLPSNHPSHIVLRHTFKASGETPGSDGHARTHHSTVEEPWGSPLE
ncbi:hypothetical protein BJ322DRAFT_852103 [Thelephora terrestris]|uniref:Uncharacterized protein n=1 Tax=Thelephora terrestris TaxID=56493 RepID=A0A9P6HEK6_9AGAM|nr:hypothetical protein BJ322DRAFT_852103 [Thelephora terrestris]